MSLSWSTRTIIVYLLVGSFASVLAARAQSTLGRIEGTVRDTSNAVISGAKVTVRNTGTNASRSFSTSNDGYYSFMALLPGVYELNVEARNFADHKSRLFVRSSATTTHNVILAVSAAATQVEVSSVATGDFHVAESQHGTTRTDVELSSLPAMARNMMNITTLAPGVQPTNNPRGASTFGGGGSYVIVLGVQSGLIAANGGRARASSVQLDHTDANDWEGGGFAPGMQAITPDMLEEFKLLTSNFTAEYGVKSNAQIMMITKSGSNSWHGSAYEFLQNDMFNARDYFDTTGHATPLKQNIYGFTMGAPVRRDRTFLFGGYEGRKVRGGAFTTLANVPSDAARARASDPVIVDLMNQFLPHATAPTQDANVGTVPVQIPSPTDTYQFVVKADHHLTDKHTISARYLQSTASFVARFPSQNSLRGFDVDNHFELRNANLGDTYIASSRTVNELRLAYDRASALGVPQDGLATPRFIILGLVNFGALQSVPAGRTFNVYQLDELLSHVHGSHVLKIGADFRKIQDNSLNATNGRGVFTFASLDKFLAGQPTSWTQLFGNTYRGFRTGVYGTFLQDDWKLKPTFTLNLGVRWEIQGALGEAHGLSSTLDPALPGAVGVAGAGPLGSFRVSGNAVHGNPFNLAPRAGFAWNPGNGKLVLRGGYGIYWDSFTFAPLNASRFAPPLNYSPTLSCSSPTACQIAGANSFDNLFLGSGAIQQLTQARIGSFGDLQNFGAITTLDPQLSNPYVQNFSLGIEYRVVDGLIASLGYIGAKATRLTRLVPINPVVNGPSPATSSADEIARMTQFSDALKAENGPNNSRLDPRFDQVNRHDSGGSSIYHSLQAELRKSFSRGLQFQASYTWSKSIDDASDFAPTIQANDNSFAQNGFDLRSERAVSNYDLPHRVVVTGSWMIPFFHSQKGLTGTMLDGWSFESVNMWQSGLPATLLAGTRTVTAPDPAHPGQLVKLAVADVNLDGNLIPTGSDNTRANCAVDSRFVLGDPDHTHGFTQPLLGHEGTCGRNSVRMSPLTNFDWSFFKNFKLRENGPYDSGSWVLQFRAELYNIFNIPFKTAQGDAWRSISSPAFGKFNAAGLTRRVQFGLRLTW